MSPTSAQAFQDDLIYWSDSYEEHVEQTERLVAALSFQGIKLNASKVHMFCSYVRYLSCIVGNEELHMDPLKVKAIDDMASPIDICSPLTDLLKKIPDPNGTVDPQTGKVRNVWAAARRTTAARWHHGLRGHVLEESKWWPFRSEEATIPGSVGRVPLSTKHMGGCDLPGHGA